MTAALAAASALLLLDVVGIILPGVGLRVDPVAVLSRAACLAGGVLVAATALCYQRRWGGACLACGRTGEAVRPTLPLALVYRWGLVFPGWVPLLAGGVCRAGWCWARRWPAGASIARTAP